MQGKLMRALWATARQYDIDSDLLHQMVFSEFAIEHISALTEAEGRYIIDKIKGKETEKPTPPGMITAAQKKYIQDMAHTLGWDDNPNRLQGFLHKYAGIDNIDWLTVGQASKVIEGLKSLLAKVET
jgi:hypothetical protein|nr:MAG TPA: Protein of unknown function (DUF1018) [Caudoviricetes sp.]